jgi:hypothetical protein
VLTLRKYVHLIGVRLTEEELRLYERLLRRFAAGHSFMSKSERFRALLRKLDFPYETVMDSEDWSFEETEPIETEPID